MNLNNCLEITNGRVTVCCPIQKTEETLDFSTLLPKFNGCFAVNNSTVAFVKDNKLYVSPYTLDIVADLKDEGCHSRMVLILNTQIQLGIDFARWQVSPT